MKAFKKYLRLFRYCKAEKKKKKKKLSISSLMLFDVETKGLGFRNNF